MENPAVYRNVSQTHFCLAKYFEEININGDWYVYDEITDSLFKIATSEEKDV